MHIELINNTMIIERRIFMKERFKSIMSFYLLATQLKNKIRSGWDELHWNVSKERLESVAEHVYGTCILALAINSEFDSDLDMTKVLKMLVLHEIGEVIIGDITPFDNVTPEEKQRIEHSAMEKVLGDLIKKEEYLALLLEFDERKTKEAIFARHCDKLEADIQAKVYQDGGNFPDVQVAQEKNANFKKRVQPIVEKGAKTCFDVWYEFDKSLYADDEVFSALLDYVKEKNTQKDF